MPSFLRAIAGAVLALCLTSCDRRSPPQDLVVAPPETEALGVSPERHAAEPPEAGTAGSEGRLVITLYFSKNEQPVTVQRSLPPTKAVLASALRELLKGPTQEELDQGITSWFSAATAGMLRGVRLTEQGRAVVDMRDFSKVIPNASTSAGSDMLLHELNGTVFQFPTVKEIEYRFDGSCERFWMWLQRECKIVSR